MKPGIIPGTCLLFRVICLIYRVTLIPGTGFVVHTGMHRFNNTYAAIGGVMVIIGNVFIENVHQLTAQ